MSTSRKLSLLISCIDWRFWPKELLAIRKEIGDFDLLEIAGASKNIASPKHKADKHVVMENIEISIELHKIKTLILTNHLDCGAYGGSKKFKSYEDELKFHKKELAKAKKIVSKKFPSLKIRKYFISKNPKNNKVEVIHIK
ncbi:MAG: hypothetical protein US50_C0040G0006 [Candidatus Nomurabacteria bacterium GW2011_GWB1_37_5]|uniref:Carbonic anhydrase n=1 Tax=Candidatus Nomurabacteria bacterium GW2011_GWB1_37_5 TaxID=1618742 RepID=A0A0G0JD34_9BACT|nr:MAG: hypothetical protein US50_C0040G0006 [Candidatus Nomurabacteria bacterium GW2011_GWB1_37_5]